MADSIDLIVGIEHGPDCTCRRLDPIQPVIVSPDCPQSHREPRSAEYVVGGQGPCPTPEQLDAIASGEWKIQGRTLNEITADNRFVEHLTQLRLGPDEVLIVRMVPDCTTEQVDRFTRWLDAVIPDTRHLVLPPVESVTTRTEAAGRVNITWPAATSAPALSNWGVTIHDADTGEQIMTGFKVSIVLGTDTTYEGGIIEADITALVGEDGEILKPPAQPIDDNGQWRTGVFRFVVAEMRIAGQPETARTLNEQRADQGLPPIDLARSDVLIGDDTTATITSERLGEGD